MKVYGTLSSETALGSATEVGSPDSHSGTWLKEHLRLVGSRAETLLELTILALDSADLPPRSLRVDHNANFRRRVECILANAIRAHFFRESNRVAYRRGSNVYLSGAKWLSAPSLRRTVDRMKAAGLIGCESGLWTVSIQGFEEGYASTYWPLQPLLDLMQNCQIDQHAIAHLLPPDSLILLRTGKTETEDSPFLTFDETEETARWRSDLERYNRFADAHEIFLNIGAASEKKLVQWWNRKNSEHRREPGIVRPELFSRDLQRIFNDGTFNHGGRLYGAWYQYVPGWLRPRMWIDGEDTVELDYAGMSVRMLYHQKGISYDDDPYAIPELEAYASQLGYPPTHFRRSIKTIVHAMLNNDDPDKRPEMVELEESFRPKYTRGDIKSRITEKHRAIEEAFGTGVGKATQRLDSDIALDVIVGLMDEGVLCLPIHDSFIVIDEHGDRLKHQMTKAYHRRLGFDPIIK